MDTDYARTEVKIRFVCSKCGDTLKCNSDASKFEFSSAFDAESRIAINPCDRCYGRARKPSEMIREALAMEDDG